MALQLDDRRDIAAAASGETVVGAPMAGWATPLEQVPDPVFSGKVLGDGLAIDPYETVLRAPCAGVVLTIHRAHHALTLTADSGAELLMHIGLDTVTLKGEGFKVTAADGQRVAPGDPDHMDHARRLLHAVADRARWQGALAEARRRAEDSGAITPAGRLLYGEPA